MKKPCKMVSGTMAEILETSRKLAPDPKLRRRVEREFKRRGMDLYIDDFGIGHLYSPL